MFATVRPSRTTKVRPDWLMEVTGAVGRVDGEVGGIGAVAEPDRLALELQPEAPGPTT